MRRTARPTNIVLLLQTNIGSKNGTHAQHISSVFTYQHGTLRISLVHAKQHVQYQHATPSVEDQISSHHMNQYVLPSSTVLPYHLSLARIITQLDQPKATRSVQVTSKLPSSPTRIEDFGISAEELVAISRNHDLSLLQHIGGASFLQWHLHFLVKGAVEKLKSNPDKGLLNDETNLVSRKKAYGSNTYPRKKGRSFWRFLWEACRDTTLIILMVAAAASLALGIKTEGIKEGWYDGGSIALAVILVIAFTGWRQCGARFCCLSCWQPEGDRNFAFQTIFPSNKDHHYFPWSDLPSIPSVHPFQLENYTLQVRPLLSTELGVHVLLSLNPICPSFPNGELYSPIEATPLHCAGTASISDYKQSLQFQNLNKEKNNIQMEVIRGGQRIKVSIFELVVGDVVPLKIGDQVPADGLVISGHSLAVDESSMTGESKIVHKDPTRVPFLMSGCKVADGYGTMLVTSVGINTEWGLLMASISEDNGEETPLQVRLNGVATFIGVVGLAVAIVVLLVLSIRYFKGQTKDPNGNALFKAGKTKIGDAINGFVKIFTVAVTIVVVAVPEGLPLAVTLTLAYSMRKMMADKALVRRLSACETMGSATTICSDKTGTLTLNQMTVVEAHAIDPPDNKSLLPPRVNSFLIEGIAHNTTGSVFVPEGGGALELSGSPTEKAILQWGVNLGMDFSAARSDSMIIQAVPFNSEKKRGGVALKLSDSEVHVHWKGAAEILIESCSSYIDANDCEIQMDEEKLSHFKKAIDDMAARSLRCLAITYRLFKVEKVPTTDEELENWQLPEDDLILLAIVGIKDPCRPNVRDAVQLCTNAGVKDLNSLLMSCILYSFGSIRFQCS
ncbi:cation-transporting atpase plant [Dorcoceras hygrometricum]|uniref:Cation-transporting atpase plant n=1 Tax=Dorcoceras hygrometricum TaxID=472368 RepID=A0A2Z7B8H0_9LAMI|nr:cation-transporting atpase plant [Dorcoceras hygrometricum]